MNRNAQTATEFVVLVFFMFVVFFIFFFAIQNQILDTNKNLERISLEEISNIAFSYIDLAGHSYTDFKKDFSFPILDNFNYVVHLEDNNTIVVRKDSKEFVNFLPYTVKGKFIVGAGNINTVYHQDGFFIDGNNKIHEDSLARGLFVNVDAEKCALDKLNGVTCSADCQLVGVC